ncbi:MAG: tetratricopeptide repeat protein [Gloeomargaritaceae cyanobacterium C42_A2020_066]|nr:tetratricopeptide repeat protein [Gloeomargaritaceae cyanobacterium C42_A2020_066]
MTPDAFEAEVLRPSFDQPVLVDFLAQWCGPCQLLKPLLTQLAAEYSVPLVLVDIDQAPAIASQYGVQGVPDVRLFREGQVADRFVGMLPEPQLRQWLSQFAVSQVDRGLTEVADAQAAGRPEVAEALLEALRAQFPRHRQVILTTVSHWVQAQRWTEAEAFLSPLQGEDRAYYDLVQALRELMKLQQAVGVSSQHPLDEAFQEATQAALAGRYAEAFEGFLALVRKDRKYREDGARKAMIALFAILGEEHPLTRQYRQQLMMALY